MYDVGLYICFINNEMDPGQELEFYYRMARDADFAMGFKRYLNLVKLIRNDSYNYIPDDELRNQVFESIWPTEKPKRPAKATLGGKFLGIFSVFALVVIFLTYAWAKGDEPNNNYSRAAAPIVKDLVYAPIHPSKTDDTSEKDPVLEILTADSHINELSVTKSYDYVNIDTPKGALLPFHFEFLKTPALKTTGPAVSPKKENALNNFLVNFIYSPLDYLDLIAQVKQETFYLSYSGLYKAVLPADYYQNPNLTSYGLGLRIYPIKEYLIKPYTELIISANTMGFILREKVGLQLKLFDYLYIVGAAEANQFRYKHDESYFTDNKYGFNYGIGIKI
eukprot:TRINITY_DN6620_c0_g1_i1.p1 TRINITY_DN6620_c0_g1~~TRINITY_DN6620_c0_g1_i1.p1  ORF type:complete len:335 (-),score=-49.03 TRINITY_DN6620_c0_g1_i1:13-1017(-)